MNLQLPQTTGMSLAMLLSAFQEAQRFTASDKVLFALILVSPAAM
jgi:hypothetical protein